MLYKVDESYKYFMKNWYTEMDLMCVAPAAVGMMYTWYFVGTMVGGILSPFPDRIGRKKSVIAGLILSTIAQTIMLFVSNMNVRSVCFFLMGFSNLKISQSYVWLSETVPKDARAGAITIIGVADAITGLIAGMYYILISRDWWPLYMFVTGLSYLAIALAFIMPESPRWLLVSGRTREGIKAINYIAWINRSTVSIPDDTQF